MKREAGMWATAAVVGMAATIGISSNQPTAPSERATAQKAAKPAARAAAQATTPLDDGPCPDIEKLLQAFFLVKEDQVVAPDSCFPEEKNDQPVSTELRGKASRMRFVIATVPDPLHTHFPLFFDRTAEAIQEAAQDGKYVYNSSWLPWDTEQSSYMLLDDQDKSDKRREQEEDQPGFLLFRGPLVDPYPKGIPDNSPFGEGLLVLIVGEEPTGGIHRRQFENAIEWITALQPIPDKHDPVQILGPTFSGSIPSLAQLLQEEKPNLAERVGEHLHIFSGTVTSKPGAEWLDEVSGDPELDVLGIEFRSFVHSDDLNLDRYCRYVNDAGTALANLAIVSEDETAFGGEYGTGRAGDSPCRPKPAADGQSNPGPVHLYYPRDISALRAAYQSQSIFARSATQLGSDPSHHTLQSDLADPEGKDHDTIRSYSGDQTALSQEAQLQQIVSLMRAHNTQYILLRSSNPLDQLFLSHFFRMTYPQGRMVIVGADLLLRREAGASGLNGVMTLTTYPLLTWEQDWTLGSTSGRFHSHRVFANDAVEGTYVAARFLLRDPYVTPLGTDLSYFIPENCGVKVPDYAPPFWITAPSTGGCPIPPTWLSVLGNGGFWPVAVLDYPTCIGCENPPGIPELGEGETISGRLRHSVTSIFSSIAFLVGANPRDGSVASGRKAWLSMPLSMKLLMLAVLFWAVFHALCCSRASITVKPAHRAYFVRPSYNQVRPLTESDAYLQRHQNRYRILLFSGSILVALLPIALAWGYGEMWSGGEPLPHDLPYRVFLVFTWSLACVAICANSCVEEYLFARKDRDPISSTRWERKRKLVWIRKGQGPAAVGLSMLCFLGLTLALYWLIDFSLDRALNDANRIPTYWRSMNLTTGVSPLVPLVSLIAGMYGWVWYSLQGIAFVGEDRPRLPKANVLVIGRSKQEGKTGEKGVDLLRMLSDDFATAPIEELSSPFAVSVRVVVGISFVALAAFGCWIFGPTPIRNLGSNSYSYVFCFWLFLCISMLLANVWQLSRIWLRLHHMLQYLDKLPLRRSLVALANFSWGSVWKMSGNVLDLRYKLIFRQLEGLIHLRESLHELQGNRCAKWTGLLFPWPKNRTGLPNACGWINALDETRDKRFEFAKWYSIHWDDWKARRLDKLRDVQISFAHTAAKMLAELLVPAWRKERESSLLSPGGNEEDDKDKPTPGAQSVASLPPHVRNAEELVCLVYVAFIQNILGRMRSLVMCIICLFLAIAVAVSSYPFDPRPLLSAIVVVLFSILSVTIITVYSQMHRDPTLSNITGTTPGELGADFWIKLVGFGAGPVLGLIASVFPEFTSFIFSWVQPGIASLK